MLEAIIFDFNGVIVDDEAILFDLYNRALAEEGIALDRAEYLARYLGMANRDMFAQILGDRGRERRGGVVARLVARTSELYVAAVGDHPPFVPGAQDLVRKAAARYPLAIASGAPRGEIEWVLEKGGICEAFAAIVAMEDVSAGKPDPEIFLATLAALNEVRPPGTHSAFGGRASAMPLGARPIRPAGCLVFEDSLKGIEAARAAGMRSVGVATSYDPTELRGADLTVRNLGETDLDACARLFSPL